MPLQDEMIVIEVGPVHDDVEGITRRAQTATEEKTLVTRFYAGAMLIAVVIHLIPALLYVYRWSENDLAGELPRWAYLQILLAILYSLYAVFLFQIPDWSALRVGAWVNLVIATIMGGLATGLGIGGSSGVFARWLGLTAGPVRQATLWCVAMLCLAVILSFLMGRESVIWRRTEDLMTQLLEQGKE